MRGQCFAYLLQWKQQPLLLSAACGQTVRAFPAPHLSCRFFALRLWDGLSLDSFSLSLPVPLQWPHAACASCVRFFCCFVCECVCARARTCSPVAPTSGYGFVGSSCRAGLMQPTTQFAAHSVCPGSRSNDGHRELKQYMSAIACRPTGCCWHRCDDGAGLLRQAEVLSSTATTPRRLVQPDLPVLRRATRSRGATKQRRP